MGGQGLICGMFVLTLLVVVVGDIDCHQAGRVNRAEAKLVGNERRLDLL
jgi:hypothetical protein